MTVSASNLIDFKSCVRARALKATHKPAHSQPDFREAIGELHNDRGQPALPRTSGTGSSSEAKVLSEIDLAAFYSVGSDVDRRDALGQFLSSRGIENVGDTRLALHEALLEYPPMSLLVNETMENALPVHSLGPLLFPDLDTDTASRATTALAALGSYARAPGNLDGPGLLPSRIHTFFRGLPGLWICMDEHCPAQPSHR